MAAPRREYVTNRKQNQRSQTPNGMTWRDYLKQIAAEEGSVEGVCARLHVTFNTAKKWYYRERLNLCTQVVCIDLDMEARKRFEAERASEPLAPAPV